MIKKSNIFNWIGLIGIPMSLFIISLLIRWQALNQTSFANGWDSYFYLDQVKHLIEHGELHTARVSILYPLLQVIQWFTQDYILSYKVLSSIIISIIPVLFFFIGKKISSSFYWGLVLGAFMIFSPHLTFFGSQYLKNTLGIVFLLLTLQSLLERKIILSILCVILSFLTHKLTGGLSIVLFYLFFVINGPKRSFVTNLFLLITPWITLVLFGMFSSRLSSEIILQPSFMPLKLIALYKESMSSLWIIEIILLLLLLFITGITLTKQHKGIILIWFLLIFMLFPFLEWNTQGLSLRLTLLLFVLSPILLLCLKTAINKYVVYVLGGLLIGLSFFSWKNYSPEKHDPNYPFYETLSHRIEPVLLKKDIQELVAHKSLAEFLSFHLEKDVMPWVPEEDLTNNLWRVGYGLSEQNLHYYLRDKTSSFYALAGNYFLIKEQEWSNLLKKVQQDDKTLYTDLTNWKNPSRAKPNFLK